MCHYIHPTQHSIDYNCVVCFQLRSVVQLVFSCFQLFKLFKLFLVVFGRFESFWLVGQLLEIFGT